MKKEVLFLMLVLMLVCGLNSFAGFKIPAPVDSEDAARHGNLVSVSNRVNGLAAAVEQNGRVHYPLEGPLDSLMTSLGAGPHTIFLGNGTYTLGDGSSYYFTKPNVTIIGKGTGSVLSGNIRFMINMATNCAFERLSLKPLVSTQDGFMMTGGTSANVVNFKMINVDIFDGADSAHCAEFTGNGLMLENVRTHALNGHRFVLKGVSNAVVKNCSSTSIGAGTACLLIKGSTLKGDCGNITVNGFSAHGLGNSLGTAVLIEAYDESKIDGVTVTDFNVECSPLNALVRVYGQNTGSLCTNIYVRGVRGLVATSAVSFGNSSASVNNGDVYAKVSDVTFNAADYGVYLVGCDVGSVEVSGLTGIVSGRAINRHPTAEGLVFSEYGSKLIINDRYAPRKTLTALTIAETAQELNILKAVDDLSSGLANANKRVSGLGSGGKFTFICNGYSFYTDNVFAGDPVFCTGTGGVYSLESWGTIAADNDEVSGSLIGDFYFVLDTTALLTGDFYPGKVLTTTGGESAGYSRGEIRVTVKGTSRHETVNCFVDSVSSVFHYRCLDGIVFKEISTVNTYATDLLHLKVWVNSDLNISVGVFGGVHNFNPTGSYWARLLAEISMFDDGVVTRGLE